MQCGCENQEGRSGGSMGEGERRGCPPHTADRKEAFLLAGNARLPTFSNPLTTYPLPSHPPQAAYMFVSPRFAARYKPGVGCSCDVVIMFSLVPDHTNKRGSVMSNLVSLVRGDLDVFRCHSDSSGDESWMLWVCHCDSSGADLIVQTSHRCCVILTPVVIAFARGVEHRSILPV